MTIENKRRLLCLAAGNPSPNITSHPLLNGIAPQDGMHPLGTGVFHKSWQILDDLLMEKGDCCVWKVRQMRENLSKWVPDLDL